jgi:hypothetical protein
MPNCQEHQQEVHAFLQKRLSFHDWKFSLPHGWGKESYFAQSDKQSYFVKIGGQVGRYLAMAEIALTPSVILHDQFDPGGFDESLQDFKAIFNGETNPEGYEAQRRGKKVSWGRKKTCFFP